MRSWEEIRAYWRTHGGSYTIRRGGQKAVQRVFGTYDRVRRKQQPTEAELCRQRQNQPEAGLISIVIPVYNTEPGLLRALLDSIRAQTYADWEAVLYDGASTRPGTLEALRAAAEEEPRFRVIRGEENRGISGNTNRALEEVRGGYTALCDHDDLLSPEALWRAAEAIARERPDMLYSDEDRVTGNGLRYMDPFYKPDFCQEDLVSGNYICHLAVIRTALLREVGGLRSGFDGSQDHDLFLRLSEKTKRIVHLPWTLYSWRELGSSMSHQNLMKCLESGCRAAEEHAARLGRKVTAVPVNKEIRLWYDIDREAAVEALIWGETEEACREGLRELDFRTPWKNLRATLLVTDAGGLFAALNEAAAGSEAEYLLVMSARTRNMNRHFIRELMMYAQMEDVAAVTGALTDRRKKITHGGFAVGVEGLARCVNEGLYVSAGGWHDQMNKVHNVSALSVGCFLIRRDHWLPLEEAYVSGLGMVDACLRQREAGRRCVFTPHATAELSGAARESKKGSGESGKLSAAVIAAQLLAGTERNPEDVRRFRETYGENLTDPCYSKRFGRKNANYHSF